MLITENVGSCEQKNVAFMVLAAFVFGFLTSSMGGSSFAKTTFFETTMLAGIVEFCLADYGFVYRGRLYGPS